jgi:hypothetical protein
LPPPKSEESGRLRPEALSTVTFSFTFAPEAKSDIAEAEAEGRGGWDEGACSENAYLADKLHQKLHA